MNRSEKEITIAKSLSGVLGVDEKIDKTSQRWLYPLYPSEYQKFVDDRSVGECMGDHKLMLLEFYDTVEYQELDPREISTDIMHYLHSQGKYELASMQIYGIWVISDTQIDIITQNYGSSADSDWTYPTFKWHDGLWISDNIEEYPWILSFDMYF